VRIVTSVIGFSGVLIVLNPTGEGWIGYGAAMGIAAVILYAFSALLLRRLGHRDGTVTIAFWFVTLVGLGAGVMAPLAALIPPLAAAGAGVTNGEG
jgi:drug/metabolite transporter (DMT)-like permease